ncbi:MAG: CocE/NonD family hydrolase, partial [bacterium]|nr:CocE/NonD family hydrolase [bacterium]
MRDGVKLFTSVYAPNDQSQNYPILLTRTPYGVHPYGADSYRDSLGPVDSFVDEGFIFVYQDVRGRYMSEGEFVNMRPHKSNKQFDSDIDESTDTFDTIEWLLGNVDGHNSRVGLWGLSYGGFYTSAGVIDTHPALVAASPQAPIADWFWDDMHHHGAFILPLGFNFFATFGQPRIKPTTARNDRFDHGTPDGYEFFLDLGSLANVNSQHFNEEIAFWNQIVTHPNYDQFWQSRNILPHLKNISCAVMTVGGWYDTEDLYGPLQTYRSIEENNPYIASSIVMGPWSHGGWLRGDGSSLGEAEFGTKTSHSFQNEALLPFFRHHLKQKGAADLPEAWVFETGANRWRSFDSWPPSNVSNVSLFLGPNGSITPVSSETSETVFDQYSSDPSKPVPYTQEITTGWA